MLNSTKMRMMTVWSPKTKTTIRTTCCLKLSSKMILLSSVDDSNRAKTLMMIMDTTSLIPNQLKSKKKSCPLNQDHRLSRMKTETVLMSISFQAQIQFTITGISLSGLSISIRWTSISRSLHFGSTDAIDDNQCTQLWIKTRHSFSRKSNGTLKKACERLPRCCARLATRMSRLSSNAYKRVILTAALKAWSHNLNNNLEL
jgi:hypothetical protein